MCISSKSVNSCVTRIFVYALQDIILLTILLSSFFENGPRFTTKYFLHYLFMWNTILLLTVRERRVEYQRIPKGELWTMDSIIIINALEFWYMPIQHQNNCVVWSIIERYRTLKSASLRNKNI
jgi:hypothetical protein